MTRDFSADPVASAIEHIGAALADAGMPPMPSRVWAALLSDPDGRMTSAELAATLGVSAAGVSGAVRYLTQIGLIRREREPGGRRDVYVAMEGAWHDLLLRADRSYAPIVRALEDGVAAASDPQARERLAESREFLLFVGAEMAKMAQRWERHRRSMAGRRPSRG